MRYMPSKYSSIDEMIIIILFTWICIIVNENVTNLDNFQIFGPTGGEGGGMGSEPGPLDVPSPGTPSENEQYDLYFDDAKYLALFQKCNIFP